MRLAAEIHPMLDFVLSRIDPKQLAPGASIRFEGDVDDAAVGGRRDPVGFRTDGEPSHEAKRVEVEDVDVIAVRVRLPQHGLRAGRHESESRRGQREGRRTEAHARRPLFGASPGDPRHPRQACSRHWASAPTRTHVVDRPSNRMPT